MELKTLKRIRVLQLDNMFHLEMVSKEVISNLSMMRIFALVFNESLKEEKGSHSSTEEEEPNNSREDYQALNLWWKDNEALLEELEGLEHINWVCFQIEGALSVQKLLSSQKLKNVMRVLSLRNLDGMTFHQLPRMQHLQKLEMCRCEELQEIKVGQEKERGRGLVADNYITNLNL